MASWLKSIGRQFDDEPGGGFADIAAGGTQDVLEDTGDVLGVNQQFDNTPGGGTADNVGAVISRVFNRTAGAAGGVLANLGKLAVVVLGAVVLIYALVKG